MASRPAAAGIHAIVDSADEGAGGVHPRIIAAAEEVALVDEAARAALPSCSTIWLVTPLAPPETTKLPVLAGGRGTHGREGQAGVAAAAVGGLQRAVAGA